MKAGNDPRRERDFRGNEGGLPVLAPCSLPMNFLHIMERMIKMKKTITKIAAAAMAVMLAGAAVPMTTAMPVYAISGSSTSDNSEVEMKAALTVAKQRVNIPEELTEFSYSTSKSYGTKVYSFVWSDKKDVLSMYAHTINVTVVGDMITSFYEHKKEKSSGYSTEPTLAKLSEEEILAKAQGYIKQLDPQIAAEVKAEVDSLNLFGDTASVSFKRYVNGVEVSGNDGRVTLNKDTGELYNFEANWWGNADFQSPKTAKSEAEIREAYKKLCKLTPYYKIQTDWTTKKKTVRIVYDPNFTSEIDAFTGEESNIWAEMSEAGGTRYYGYDMAEPEEACAEDAVGNPATGADGGVVFSEAELKKIQQDASLITPEKAFEMLKKDKYAALTDDYEIKSYEVYTEDREFGVMPFSLNSDENVKDKYETFYISIYFTAKDKAYKGYKSVQVTLNAETGELISLFRYNTKETLPQLDAEKANAIAEGAAKQYAKDIFSEFKAYEHNVDAPVPVEEDENGEPTGKVKKETSREFSFDRYVNGIQVYGDSINVTVDSNGVVTSFSYNYTDDVKFPSADILSADEALDKLYTYRDFNYYYTGWIAKDGKVKTYLVYDMDYFYLNAKTGKLCNWDGSPRKDYTNGRDVTYTDIKGIPQEQAILALQKYGVTITKESQFKPNENITKEEFNKLLSAALRGNGVYYYDAPEEEELEVDATDENGKPIDPSATRTDAAVMFVQQYDRNDIAKLKGIYKTPFSDVKSSDENIGYIAIAYAKGFILKGDGKFNGEQKITRAEAMQMIYDYLAYITK